jgi:hypothetical protein
MRFTSGTAMLSAAIGIAARSKRSLVEGKRTLKSSFGFGASSQTRAYY